MKIKLLLRWKQVVQIISLNVKNMDVYLVEGIMEVLSNSSTQKTYASSPQFLP
jgi:hypothetical protein